MGPLASYYLAICRTLHSVDVGGPTAVSGWKRFVNGEPYIHTRIIILIGDSWAFIYGSGAQPKRHIVAKDLVSHAGYAKGHDLNVFGAHPSRWLEMLVAWQTALALRTSPVGSAWRSSLFRKRLCRDPH